MPLIDEKFHGGLIAVIMLAAATLLEAGAEAVSSPGEQPLAVSPVDSNDVRGEWPMYNNGYNGQRYSELRDLTPETVLNLQEVCKFPVAALGAFEAAPVMVDGTLYITAGPRTAAIDARNCALRWMNDYNPAQREAVRTNRGVAVMNGKVFRGTGDARLIALDSTTGRAIWKDVVGDPTRGEAISGAPLTWNGLVIVGLAGGDFGIRGRITAFDGETGREIWRFNTIPKDDEAGAKTWRVREGSGLGGGGGGTWSSFALDPSTAELFVPVGNPEPAGLSAWRQPLYELDAGT
jgi:alcohol dehydrogenase (cytochrome c)